MSVPSRESLLRKAEESLEAWIRARGEEPTQETVEGFRLLALHRQGCKGVPSFNACRETCREVAFHFNLLGLPLDDEKRAKTAAMMERLAKHLQLFVEGKMQVEGLGEFCCSSRPLRLESPAGKSEEPSHA